MSTVALSGALLIVMPIVFNAAFGLLAARFDYPEVLRRPTADVLDRFRQGGTALLLIWWAFALSAVLFAPLAVLVSRSLGGAGGADETLLAVGSTVGVLAGIVQFLGLVRWPFLVPYLARVDAEPGASAARREAVDVVFQAANRYLGVAVGEHLGYLFTGAWSALAAAALWQSGAVPAWVALPGILVGPVLMLCSLEFVGAFEPHGWKLAGALTPIAYVVWSAWLAAVGVAFLFA